VGGYVRSPTGIATETMKLDCCTVIVLLLIARCRKANSSYILQTPTHESPAGNKKPLQSVSRTSQLVKPQEASPLTPSTRNSTSSVTTQLTSLTPSSSSSSSQPQSPTSPVAKPTSETTSQPTVVTYDDDGDDIFHVYDDFGLTEKLSPVNANIHLYPPIGSYQPCALPCEPTYKREMARSTGLERMKLAVHRQPTTTASNVSSSNSSSKWRHNICQREGDSDRSVGLESSVEPATFTQSSRDVVRCVHDDSSPSTSDVTTSTTDVTANYYDFYFSGASSESKSVTLVTSCPPQQSSSEQVTLSSFTSPASEHGSDSTSAHADDTQCNEASAADHVDSGTYQKLERPDQQSLSGYTALRPQCTRNSVMSVASYDSIPTITRYHRAAPTADNSDYDQSILTGDYLHPGSVHGYSVT